MKKSVLLTTITIILLISHIFAQTPEQKRLIEEIKRKSDSIRNSPQMQELMRKYEQQQNAETEDNKFAEQEYKKIVEINEAARKKAEEQAKIRQDEMDRREAEFEKNKPQNTIDISPIDENISYSLTSVLEVKTDGAASGPASGSITKIYHTPQKERYERPDKPQSNIVIFRRDKDILWLVYPEVPAYAGVKLYQEFKLKGGGGINSHIDQIVMARKDLLHPVNMEKVGMETVNGQPCTKYKKQILSWNKMVLTYFYWVNNDKILVKMVSRQEGEKRFIKMENKNIKKAPQASGLFLPPSGWKKAGYIIEWEKEKAALKKN